MLKLKKIEIDNFGPYKNLNTIELSQEDGVTIVYGENMKGKTSLLNAFRYVLFGKVLGRGSKEISLHEIGNWESAEEGKFGFKVELYFSNNDVDYILTRQHVLRSGVTIPESDLDYVNECYLKKNGDVLSPSERDLEIKKIMPEQVSRFFLFDGELLQEYEELLDDESSIGLKISEAIELILGVPILTNARADLRKQYEASQKQESKEAQKNQKTRELGKHLANLTEKRARQLELIEKYKNELRTGKEKKAALEASIRRQDRFEMLLNEKDKLGSDIPDLERKIKEKKEKLQEMMANIWKGALTSKITKIKEELHSEILIIQGEKTKAEAAKELMKSTILALESGHCPTCLNVLNEEAKKELEKVIKQSTSIDAVDEKRLEQLQRKYTRLNEIDLNNSLDLIKEVQNSIDELTVEIASKEDKVREIIEQVSDIDPRVIRTTRNDYDKIIKDNTLIEQAITAETNELNKTNEAIKGIEAKLDQESDDTLGKERRRREIYGKLVNLFEEGVTVYRERLKSQVEKDASELFLKLTTEKEYVGLEINSSYGLTIKHASGKTIPIRSAGAEHIVALSLIGALQKNTPLHGPIIMDSPFGRLDENHTVNIVRALPSMARQITLLVYERELRPQVARNELLGKLKQEYKLIRVTSRQTEIKKSSGAIK